MSAHLVNARAVKHFFYNALALNALPVHLLRQVHFFMFWSFFFRFCFLLVFWKVLEGSFGARMVHFGSILIIILDRDDVFFNPLIRRKPILTIK